MRRLIQRKRRLHSKPPKSQQPAALVRPENKWLDTPLFAASGSAVVRANNEFIGVPLSSRRSAVIGGNTAGAEPHPVISLNARDFDKSIALRADRKTISAMDSSGLRLAAIQGLR